MIPGASGRPLGAATAATATAAGGATACSTTTAAATVSAAAAAAAAGGGASASSCRGDSAVGALRVHVAPLGGTHLGGRGGLGADDARDKPTGAVAAEAVRGTASAWAKASARLGSDCRNAR